MKRVLVVIDIQKEYETPGRSYFIKGIEKSLRNARRVLEFARSSHWTVYHVRHLQDGDLFGKDSPFSDYISGFEPVNGEGEFVKSDYSCYSSPEFAEQIKKHASDEVVVIGYGTTRCCLATIVDGYHRGQKFTFVSDAASAKRSEQFDEESLHAAGCDILTTFAKVLSTDALVTAKA